MAPSTVNQTSLQTTSVMWKSLPSSKGGRERFYREASSKISSTSRLILSIATLFSASGLYFKCQKQQMKVGTRAITLPIVRLKGPPTWYIVGYLQLFGVLCFGRGVGRTKPHQNSSKSWDTCSCLYLFEINGDRFSLHRPSKFALDSTGHLGSLLCLVTWERTLLLSD
jgi:hypothetical protein